MLPPDPGSRPASAGDGGGTDAPIAAAGLPQLPHPQQALLTQLGAAPRRRAATDLERLALRVLLRIIAALCAAAWVAHVVMEVAPWIR